MSNFAELCSSLKDELVSRYRSPFWGTALIAIFAVHWRIVLYFLFEKPNSANAIAFVEGNLSACSILSALTFAATYVALFPWFELALSKVASYGTRSRNDFQIRERERENGRRKVIAQQEAKIIEIELKNKEDQSKLADIALAKDYLGVLSGENFTRWLKDAQNGAINTNLGNSIINYLNRVDSLEGKFINAEVEKTHEQFVEAISTLGSAINDARQMADEAKKTDLVKFSRNR